MKAVVIYEAGGVDKLIYQDVETPKVKPGWSLVKVKGFGINRSEIFTRQGYSESVHFPRILGIECVGIVVGSTEPERIPEGTKVVSIMGEMGRAFDGSYAEYVLLPNEQIYKVETDLDWPTMAAVPETYHTAFGTLKNLKIENADTVLVRGAASGVGVAFAKLLKGKYPKVRLYGSTRNTRKADRLKAAGFDDVVVENEGRLDTALAFDKIADLVGPSAMADSLAHLKDGGILCNTGLLGGTWTLDDFDIITELGSGKYITGFYSGLVDEGTLQALFDLIAEYHIDAGPEKIFSLRDIREAQAYLDSANSFGKVVVVND
ncbi:zinc-binding dehydrogenase [Megasphaera sp.]|uniref:zinc-binding dehydrogenase n=1 Tax=Megasphaera sp. TaxID=2023260 RepID=UPI0025CFB0DE|nr:zinc-binding dehydrogenase [uncultured Megasphaera sp.]